MQSFSLNNYRRILDGQWQGIRYASDGNVYFASSTHSAHHGASFFRYNPRTSQVTLLAEDITTICGENPQINPQGKIHSDIVEGGGWLYFSTHFSSEYPGAYNSWTGSHVIGYELASGQFRDYGVVHPNYTSYSGIGVDAVRNYLYVFVTGQNNGQVSYLYRIHTVTGAKTNLGQVGTAFNASFYMFVDRRGDAWFSVGSQNGALHRVHGETGRIDVYPNVLPPVYRWDVEAPDPSPSAQANRWIQWMQPLDGDRAVFTVGWYGGMLYMFDSSKPIGSGQEFRPVKHIGFTDLGLAVGANRVYYYQRANRQYGNREFRDFHLLSVSLDPAADYAITDHGLLKDQDGRLVWRLPGMMTDGQNKVFGVGDLWTIAGDVGTLRYNYNGGAERYDQLPRGEFFIVADVVTGTINGSEAEVQGNNVVITDGDTTPTTSEGTHFGSSATAVTRVFTVFNRGTAPLTTSALAVTGGFIVTEGLSSSIAAGGSDTFSVQLSAAKAGVYNGTVTFTNNDSNENPYNFAITGTITPTGIPAITVSVPDANAAESGNPSTDKGMIRFTRSITTSSPLTVNFSKSGTAAHGATGDYVLKDDDGAAITSSVVIDANESSVGVIVEPYDNVIIESVESAILTVTSGTGYTIGSPNSGTVTIADNEPVVTISATDSAAGESPGNPGMLRINLTTAPTFAPLSVRFTLSGSSAVHPGDYTLVVMNPDGSEGAAVGSPVSVPIGRTYLDIRLKPVDDTVREAVESARISLMSSAGNNYKLGSGTVAIVNIASNE